VAPNLPEASDHDLSDNLYNKLVHEGKDHKGMTGHEVAHEANKKTATDRKNTGQLQVSDRSTGLHQFFGQHSYGTAITDRIVQAFHGDKSQIEVIDDKGKVQKFDSGNQDQQLKLAAGQYKWRHKGDKGGGMSEIDTPEDINDKFSTDRPFATQGTNPGTGSRGKGQSGAQGQVMIDLSPEAKRFFQISGTNPVPLTPNSEAANSGQGNAAVNNPPPGDSPVPGRYVPSGRFGLPR
jgi:hypothetical protein